MAETHAKALTRALIPMPAPTGPHKWRLEHQEAVRLPKRGFEGAIVDTLKSLAEYADAHRDRYESEVGEDGVLGDHFEEIARGLIGLLNGETGRLDCGTLDRAIRQLCRAAKVEGIEQ